MAKQNTHPLPEAVCTQIQAFNDQIAHVQNVAQAYVAGIIGAYGLEGEWKVDVQNKVLVKVEPNSTANGHSNEPIPESVEA